MKVHWITLDPKSQRGRRFVEGCEAVGMESEPLVVTRGDTSNIVVTADMRSNLTRSELGCMSSHLKMMDMAANSEDSWFFVCEDDVDLKGWIRGWTVEGILDREENRVADIVKFHMHALPLMNKLSQVYANGNPIFIKDEPLDNMAYAIRPAAAKRLVETYKSGNKWIVPGGVAVDVWFRKLAMDGELYMNAAPLLGEMHDLDSSLISSKFVLRFRKVGDETVRKTTLNPTTNRGVFAARLAGETVLEFKKEIALAVVAVSALTALIYFATRQKSK